LVGGVGGAIGVTELDAKDQAPWPAAFTAATRKTYVVPLVSPPTTAEVVFDTPSENTDQYVPLEEYWMM
jgi:hypothetical protein